MSTSSRSQAGRSIELTFWAQFFGLFIRQYREKAGRSVEEAARRAGMETCEWLAVEKGWIPRPAQLLSIADAIDVPQDTMGSLVQFCQRAWER